MQRHLLLRLARVEEPVVAVQKLDSDLGNLPPYVT